MPFTAYCAFCLHPKKKRKEGKREVQTKTKMLVVKSGVCVVSVFGEDCT